jgi:hypothetical protein
MCKRLSTFRIEMKGNRLSDGKGVSGKGHLTDNQIDSQNFIMEKPLEIM